MHLYCVLCVISNYFSFRRKGLLQRTDPDNVHAGDRVPTVRSVYVTGGHTEHPVPLLGRLHHDGTTPVRLPVSQLRHLLPGNLQLVRQFLHLHGDE